MKLKNLILAPLLLLCLASAARGSELLFSQFSDNQFTHGPSQASPFSGTNSEIADDFAVKGRIDRIVAHGLTWRSVEFLGVYVRFYEFGVGNAPGALQQEYFLAAGDANLMLNSTGTLSATLSPAFWATGRHFVSVQPLINSWYWWSSNSGAPFGQSFYFRNLAAGQTVWQTGDHQLFSSPQADVSFLLYGTLTSPGVIDSLSASTLPRSGFLEIFGSNFGGDGQVLIGDIPAPVSSWSSTRVVAYVPESAPLTTVGVQVVNAAGASNTVLLSVTERPPASGRINWRFRMDGPYSMVRPAIGPDGTIYAVDVFEHLYALAPDGGLKWIVRAAGDKGVAAGPDNTVYVASENHIKAFNPDGSLRWTFVQNPRAFICLGVSVGPDGNIYSVGVEGLGVFSLSPAGELRWAVPEAYNRPIVTYAEIVFGPNGSDQQLYFGANAHTRALRLDGQPVFTIDGSFQPAIGPDGSVHSALAAYSPNGTLLWNFVSPYPYNIFTAADVGSNGLHYFTQNRTELFALNADGSLRWHVTVNKMGAPVIDPFNSILVLGSANTLNYPGTIQGVSAANGKNLWLVTLPTEDPTVFNENLGIYGYNQGVSTRGRFSPDGQTVYFMTYTATGDNNTSRSFVYSINVAGGGSTPLPSPAQLLRSTDISLSAKLFKNGMVNVSGAIMVKDENGARVSGATVGVSWRWPDGTIQNQTANTSNTGIAKFSTRDGRGTYTLTINNITKSGYTFDRVNSILSRSTTVQ